MLRPTTAHTCPSRCFCLSRAEEGVPPEQHAALRASSSEVFAGAERATPMVEDLSADRPTASWVGRSRRNRATSELEIASIWPAGSFRRAGRQKRALRQPPPPQRSGVPRGRIGRRGQGGRRGGRRGLLAPLAATRGVCAAAQSGRAPGGAGPVTGGRTDLSSTVGCLLEVLTVAVHLRFEQCHMLAHDGRACASSS